MTMNNALPSEKLKLLSLGIPKVVCVLLLTLTGLTLKSVLNE